MIWSAGFAQTVKDLGVFAQHTGNPVIPAYLADASFFYDAKTNAFYAFGTNDGAGGGNVFPPQAWYSYDGKTWKNKIIDLPKSWTDFAGTTAVWAPSMIYYQPTRKYYLMYSINFNVFIAMSNSPLGPWEDANGEAPGKMFFKGYDGQFFVDDDQKVYFNFNSNPFRIIKFRFDAAGKIFFDNDDARFTKTEATEFLGSYHYVLAAGLKNAFEASFIYKRKGLYYLMWSFKGSEEYNVRYAVSKEVTGPYTELDSSETVPILQRDDKNNILGPGHHSVFDYNGHTYIAYHRQHFPFVDSKRQTCIDEMLFNTDGSIKKVTPTHRGVQLKKIAPAKSKNLALGKQTLTSSDRVYANGPYAKRYRTHDISFKYEGKYAVDENYGTHWDAGLDAKEPWIIVDLAADHKIDSIETMFEFTSRAYYYKLEYLNAKDAGSLATVAAQKNWKMFTDRLASGAKLSPVTDRVKQPVNARFVRLTITHADIPKTADESDPVNADNALSIFELKVFGK
ncbi:family 43 glycosylhydrolase [Mucilaginibacter corticis]|uniref:Family 43 glycosylhydrolase n=2 Tax=Mucilaginibacter corticis TaxID=2597670 RepID=A0A556MXQ5_9SPHI|nr:family 43 glycosylhydrolase [Mucilaginibacter corticis]